jgi:colicin import membrane protein
MTVHQPSVRPQVSGTPDRQIQREATPSDTTPATRTTCKHPGCTEPAAPSAGPGRPPEYCEGRGHNRVSAWRERRRLAVAQAGTTPGPADTDNPVTMAKVTDAEQQVAAAEADRDAVIARARAEADQQVTSAQADRDQAVTRAEQADRAAGLAWQEAADAQAAAEATRTETAQARDDAEKMLAGFRAEAARDRDELRADLRARAERAERDADAYRDELARLRAETSHGTDATASGRTPRRARPAT